MGTTNKPDDPENRHEEESPIPPLRRAIGCLVESRKRLPARITDQRGHPGEAIEDCEYQLGKVKEALQREGLDDD